MIFELGTKTVAPPQPSILLKVIMTVSVTSRAKDGNALVSARITLI